MAGHTLVPMRLIVMVLHSKDRRDAWTYTRLTHATVSDGPTHQGQA